MLDDLDIKKVKILTQPLVPLALHYLAPRKIMGSSKWKRLKKKYRTKADHHCMICGRYVSHTPGDWLELHEEYTYDFNNMIQKLTGYVSICHDCHMYIHQGLLGIQLAKGQISPERYAYIINKGNQLLDYFNLYKIKYPSEEVFTSPEWKLEFEGQFYHNRNYQRPMF